MNGIMSKGVLKGVLFFKKKAIQQTPDSSETLIQRKVRDLNPCAGVSRFAGFRE